MSKSRSLILLHLSRWNNDILLLLSNQPLGITYWDWNYHMGLLASKLARLFQWIEGTQPWLKMMLHISNSLMLKQHNGTDWRVFAGQSSTNRGASNYFQLSQGNSWSDQLHQLQIFFPLPFWSGSRKGQLFALPPSQWSTLANLCRPWESLCGVPQFQIGIAPTWPCLWSSP